MSVVLIVVLIVDLIVQGRTAQGLRTVRDAAGGFFGNMYNRIGRSKGENRRESLESATTPTGGANKPGRGIAAAGRSQSARAPKAGVKALPAPKGKNGAGGGEGEDEEGSSFQGDDESVATTAQLPQSGPRMPNSSLAMVAHISNWTGALLRCFAVSMFQSSVASPTGPVRCFNVSIIRRVVRCV